MSTRRITAARPFSWTTLALALGLLAMGLPGMAESVDPAVARRVARIELAKSILAFAASTLATSDCLVRAGRISRQQANQAMPIALREMGISPTVLSNPQVRKAAQMLQTGLSADCEALSINEAEAQRLVNDEL